MKLRIGNGYDTHPLLHGKSLILGGVEIPSEKGIEGHSDGDVLIHAIVDALLGSLSLGDIGSFFPSTSKWKGCSSHIFLNEVLQKIKSNNYKIVNIDSTIILQKPKINSYIPLIRDNLSKLMNIDIDQISIKATTTDYLGFIGRGEGIAAIASVLICKDIK